VAPTALRIVGADPALAERVRLALDCERHGPLIVTADAAAVATLRLADPAVLLVVIGARRRAVCGALDDGADAVLTGVLRPAELRARVRALGRRRELRLTVGSLELEPASRLALLDGDELRLTAREFALLCCLASAPGRVFSKAELRRSCFGPLPQSSRALERHAVRLRRALGRHAPMLVTVWGVGYRLAEPA
jgi:DNA-binding response OmpR family regulator